MRALAPEPRRSVRAALKSLENEKGDIKQLEGDLSGYARLRVGTHRVLIRFYAERGERVARCLFAEKRAVVYELFAEILRGQSPKG